MGGVSDFRIEEIPLPPSLDEDAGPFVESVEVGAAVRREGYGNHFIFTPREELFISRDPDKPVRIFVARRDGRIVGRATLAALVRDPGTAWLTVEVLSEHRRAGIGSALLSAVEGEAERRGGRKFITAIRIVEQEGPRIAAPTGYGSMPAEGPQARFLRKHGYSFEQIVRASRVPLPVSAAATMFEESARFAGADYRIHYWIGATPARWLEGMASLASRMSTDVPQGELAPPEDRWTAERVSADDARRAAEDDLARVVAAVEHVPSGELVGYTEYLVPPEPERDAMQWFTIVAPEHRGHRLGTLLKVANLRYLGEAFPGRAGVVTGNAEENRPMLDINEKLGFTPIGYEAEWKKEQA